MNIEITGAGRDLVLIHGWAMHSGIFAPLTEILAQRFRLHLVDLPGHGASPERDVALTLDDCVSRIANATPPAIWIGWSLGGLVALRAALDVSPQVRGLVMIASSPRFVIGANWPFAVAPEVFEQFGADLGRDYRGTLDRFLALEVHGSDCARDELRELREHLFERGEPALRVLQDALNLLEPSDMRAELAQLDVPSLWLAGARDRLIPWQAMQWAAEHSCNAHFEKIVGGGHAPFIGHADVVARAISAFVDSLPA
jgi:pimeloyl-[acyl-carrier protein] methyl ester esterase